MTDRERTVLVIASGLALAVLASVLSALVWAQTSEDDGGWFAYAPGTGPIFSERGGLSVELALLVAGGIWLAAIAIWASVAIRIYRARFDGSRRIGKQPEGA